MHTVFRLALLPAILLAAPLAARDSLGVFGDWGAFRDPQVPRCYAIAAPTAAQPRGAFASVGTWPVRQVRAQFHVRPSRALPASAAATLRIGGANFALRGGPADLWAADPRADAAIVAAMRSASRMSITARDARGRAFTDSYSLEGAATALDAALVGCARAR